MSRRLWLNWRSSVFNLLKILVNCTRFLRCNWLNKINVSVIDIISLFTSILHCLSFLQRSVSSLLNVIDFSSQILNSFSWRFLLIVSWWTHWLFVFTQPRRNKYSFSHLIILLIFTWAIRFFIRTMFFNDSRSWF